MVPYTVHKPSPDLSWEMVCRDLFSKRTIPWPGTRSRACHLIFSWTHCLLNNLTWHILYFSSSSLSASWLHVLFYSAIPIDRRTFSFFPTLLPCYSNPACPQRTHMLTHPHSLFKKSSHRCQECVCCPFDTESDAIFGAMGRAEPQDVAFVYSAANLARIFTVALLWASRQGTGPASSHSFTLHQDSIIISPLTLAGSSCPKPSTVNGAQYISPLSLQPSQCLSTCPVP